MVHFHPPHYAHFNPLWVVYYARFLHFNAKTNTMEYEGVWDTPELEFTTKDRLVLVEKINHLLFYLQPYIDNRIMLKPGVVDELNEAIRQELL